MSVSARRGQARESGLESFVSVNTGAKIHDGMVAIDAIGSDGEALLALLDALGL